MRVEGRDETAIPRVRAHPDPIPEGRIEWESKRQLLGGGRTD